MISPKSILEPVLPKTEGFRKQKIRYLGILKNFGFHDTIKSTQNNSVLEYYLPPLR